MKLLKGFPVTISQPGSYRLSSDLTVPNARTTAIQITTDDVTLDLNGFAIVVLPICLASIVAGSTVVSNGFAGVAMDDGGLLVGNGEDNLGVRLHR